jgi:CDGSH-type Zn-finger protein|tara:strand:- start:2661 stop:2927 length:267 start_codon:yes stop_codon:yes gene_type:complete
MSEPLRASDTPYATDVEAGQTYYWCSCGKSTKQPLCDGSHQGTEFTPVAYKAEATKQVFSVPAKLVKAAPCVMEAINNLKCRTSPLGF